MFSVEVKMLVVDADVATALMVAGAFHVRTAAAAAAVSKTITPSTFVPFTSSPNFLIPQLPPPHHQQDLECSFVCCLIILIAAIHVVNSDIEGMSYCCSTRLSLSMHQCICPSFKQRGVIAYQL